MTTPDPPGPEPRVVASAERRGSAASTATRSDGARPLELSELATLRATLPHGGVDDSNRDLAVPPALRANLGPLTNSLRWGAVGFGLVYAVPLAIDGDLAVVVGLSLCMFLTTWRTVIPLRLGSPAWSARIPALFDAAVLGVAMGVSGGSTSMFVGCLVVAVLITAMGWGTPLALLSSGVGWAMVALGMVLTSEPFTPVNDQSMIPAAGMFAGLVLVGFGRRRLLDAEARRVNLSRRVSSLNETNDLLSALNSIARTLPGSLNLRDAVDSIRRQLIDSFDPQVIALLERDTQGGWTPRLAEGTRFSLNTDTDELPARLADALDRKTPVLAASLEPGSGLRDGSTSGVYTALRARNEVVGVVGIETTRPGGYGAREVNLLSGLSDLAALTLDNARRFGHLRTLGAQNERTRIARDLHDRLGQWLTYFKLELERVCSRSDDDPELLRLSQEADHALNELRETLRQLRSEVDDRRTFVGEAQELIGRLEARSDLKLVFEVTDPDEKLTPPVETEILRIMQEALNNVEKHAKASEVLIRWSVADGAGVLTVRDDGRGFETRDSVRDSSYGLVGMRERADAIGARLDVASQPGSGTTITVSTADHRSEGPNS
ncbi:MAG: GAF domain-containing sensor histidine kinase [Microthrixaceae bacterium]|nr:GAF domain-containing sensor histidine kinase [Microthrixaceae bacterium]